MSEPTLGEIIETTNAITTACRAAWELCDRTWLPGDIAMNLPEILSAALTQLAEDLGSTEALVKHRPGSWEAVHVRALGFVSET